MKVKKYGYITQLTFFPGIFPVNCYLVEESDYFILVDAGIKQTTTKLIKYIKKQSKPLKKIILTHAHSDHVGDLKTLKATFPAAELLISTKEYEATLLQNIESILSLPIKPTKLLKENDQVASLQVVALPGHTPGQIGLLDVRTQNMIVGDLLQTKGGLAICGDKRWSFPFPAYATNDLASSLISTEKIAKMQIEKLFVGHGEAISAGDIKWNNLIVRAKKLL